MDATKNGATGGMFDTDAYSYLVCVYPLRLNLPGRLTVVHAQQLVLRR